MATIIHHKPAISATAWNMHLWQPAWNGNFQTNVPGTPNGDVIDFQFPAVPEARSLQFKFQAIAPNVIWESDDFTRRLNLTAPAEAWTFDSSPRILYQHPFPPGVFFNPGDQLTFHVITKNAFSGGQIYTWNPYDPTKPEAYFAQSSRDEANSVSTFQVTLEAWMTNGFHLKLMHGKNWEPDSSNRVWRPCDGSLLWLKSGQADVRNQPLTLTAVPLEVLHANSASAPIITLTDTIEGSTFPITASSSQPYHASNLFTISTYAVPIYPAASYAVTTALESQPIRRPFPANPAALDFISRFVIGASAWVTDLPTPDVGSLTITPRPHSSFQAGVSIAIHTGNALDAYATIHATQSFNGNWLAQLPVLLDTTTSIRLLPAAAAEPKPYAQIDTSRYFTPNANQPMLFTAEGVYGVTTRGTTFFAEPLNRRALMQAAFGEAIVAANLFDNQEMPHGATLVGQDVYFVIHAPHAVDASVILVNEQTMLRTEIPMQLTPDTLYWWCHIPLAQAAPGTRYRFLLNGNIEIIDPAARAVHDGASLDTNMGDNPADPNTSWAVVLDTAAVYQAAHAQIWQTMGWQKLLIYEIHSRRFTNIDAQQPTPFASLIDELQATTSRGTAGYLHQLPVTALGLLPVNEFKNHFSWGYDPSYYFAIDSFYGGAHGLANLVSAAHAQGRAVLLDVVYNHSLGSSLMKVAVDVYRAGDAYGDLMNCGHPMVNEFFRQVSVFLTRTFNLDGFRFDDTNTIVTRCKPGGWAFLGMIRDSIRRAAAAEGKAWPYCVAENSGDHPWDVSDPGFGVMDGQWGIDEVYRIRDASYDIANRSDSAASLREQMNMPSYMGRPFHQVVRFGESHDMVSAQNPDNKRIAARPAQGLGLQMAKALGSLTLLSNGIPMLFMGQEIGETTSFSFENNDQWINPQRPDLPADQARVLAWFRQLMGLRNDAAKGLQGNANDQRISTGNRTVAFTCGANQQLFAAITFGTANQQQNSAWLGLPAGTAYKEIFNSSWPFFQVESEPEHSNGGYNAVIRSGQTLNLPYIGAVILERR